MALRNHRLAALTLFGAMAVLHSWPLATDPVHLARLDIDDAAQNAWAIAWVAHVLPRSPLSVFEAPIFYPEHNTLAYSEPLILQAMMGAPLLWAGASPVLVQNLLLIAGLALSGWAMYLLMQRWTGNSGAAVISGLAYAFNAHVLTRFAHIQAQHVEFFPVALYFLDRVITRSPNHAIRSPAHQIIRSPDVWLLTASIVLQSLAGNYLMVFTAFALVASALVRWRDWAVPHRAAARYRLLAAAALCAVAIAPIVWPYIEVSRTQGLTRSVDEVARFSATWRDYLVTGGRLHYEWWSHDFWDGRTALFPGLTAATLAIVTVSVRRQRQDPRVRMAIGILVVGVLLSFGANLPGFAWLHAHVPPFSGIRNAARWGWLALAAVAILAGFGVASLTNAARGSARWAVPAVLAALVTVEALRAPVGYTVFDGIPAIYDRLAGRDAVVLAEFPIYAGADFHRNGRYVLANTRYFKPLVNGYSGFQPATYEARVRVLATFPSADAVAMLRTLGVTHVMTHGLAPASTALDLIAEEGAIRLYRLR